MRDRWQPAWWILLWFVTRAFMVIQVGFWRADGPVFQDVDFFAEAAREIAASGTIPLWETWQYPPGAVYVVLLPRLFPGHYAEAFVGLMLVMDAIGLVALAAQARREGRPHGVWVWLLGIPALSVFPILRFDLVPTVLAVVALVLLPRSAAVVGALAGLGGMIKVWPMAVLLAEADRRRLVVAVAAAGGAVVLVTGVTMLAFGDPTSFLVNQGGRGLQAEAVAGSAFHLREVVTGQNVDYVGRFGALEIDSPVADAIATALEWVMLALGLCVAAWWWARDRAIHRHGRLDLATVAAGRDAVFTAVLLSVVASKVLSPQFVVWLVGLAAVLLATPGSRLRRPTWTVVGAIGATAALYASQANFVVRNVLLLVAAVDAAVVMVRAVRSGPPAEAADVVVAVSPNAPVPTGLVV